MTFQPVRCRENLITLAFQNCPYDFAYGRFVIHDQDAIGEVMYLRFCDECTFIRSGWLSCRRSPFRHFLNG